MKRSHETVGNVLADWKNAPWWPDRICTIFYLAAMLAFAIGIVRGVFFV